MDNTQEPTRLTPSATVSIQEAARLCGVSDDTINRRLKDGTLAGAYRRPGDRTRAWAIPVTDLVAAGLLDPSVVDTASSVLAAQSAAAEILDLRLRVARLETQVDSLQDRLRERNEDIAAWRRVANTRRAG